MFLICHKGSYRLSSSPTVLQIFTPRCEDMPETQLWVTIGQWDRHPWPGNETQHLSLFTLLSLGTSPEVLLMLLFPRTSQEVLSPSCLLWDSGTSPEVLSCGLQDAPELPPELSPEVLSPQGIFFWTSAAESCKQQPQQTKRTSSYSSDARSCVATVSISSFAKAC